MRGPDCYFANDVSGGSKGILDSGRTHTRGGEDWLKSYVDAAVAKYRRPEVYWRKKALAVPFRLGNDTAEVRCWTFTIPIFLKDNIPSGYLEVCDLKGDQAPLPSKSSQGELGLVIDYEEDALVEGVPGIRGVGGERGHACRHGLDGCERHGGRRRDYPGGAASWRQARA